MSRSPSATVFAKYGTFQGLEVEVGDGATLGRSDDNAVVLAVPEVSSHHARIVFDQENGCFVIEDLGSRNGTFVDGLEVEGAVALGEVNVLSLGGADDVFFRSKFAKPADVAAGSPDRASDAAPSPVSPDRTVADTPLPDLAGALAGIGEPMPKRERTRFDETAPTLPTFDKTPAERAQSAKEAAGATEIGQTTDLPSDDLWLVLHLDSGAETVQLPFEAPHKLDIIVGRGSRSDVRIDHPHLSRRHARIVWRDGRVFVQDLGSSNQTFVGEQEAKDETPLGIGSVLCFGDLAARLVTRAETSESDT